MKVLLINGSPRQAGCTHTTLCEVASALDSQGIETEILWLGNKYFQDCIGCGSCRKTGKCCFDDDGLSTIVEKCSEADGFVFGSPVYYSHPSGRLLSFMDRLFYSSSNVLRGKPAAAVVSARRAGTSASLDVIMKYFTIAQMPVVSSSYWNMVHGACPADVLQDAEGLQTMRNLGKNMAQLLKALNNSSISMPCSENEYGEWTNFIR